MVSLYCELISALIYPAKPFLECCIRWGLVYSDGVSEACSSCTHTELKDEGCKRNERDCLRRPGSEDSIIVGLTPYH